MRRKSNNILPKTSEARRDAYYPVASVRASVHKEISVNDNNKLLGVVNVYQPGRIYKY